MTIFSKSKLICLVKEVNYERNGTKYKFNKIETVIKGVKYTVKMSRDFAQQNGLDKLEKNKTYVLLNVKYTKDNRSIYPVAWLKSITGFQPYDFDVDNAEIINED